MSEVSHETTTSVWDREQQRLDQMKVASVFGGTAVEHEEEEIDGNRADVAEHANEPHIAAAAGTLEEEEIEEEEAEADLAHYVEDLAEEDDFVEEWKKKYSSRPRIITMITPTRLQQSASRPQKLWKRYRQIQLRPRRKPKAKKRSTKLEK